MKSAQGARLQPNFNTSHVNVNRDEREATYEI